MVEVIVIDKDKPNGNVEAHTGEFVFAFCAKKVGEDSHATEYCTPAIVKGNGSPVFFTETSASCIREMIKLMADNDPGKIAAMKAMFIEEFLK